MRLTMFYRFFQFFYLVLFAIPQSKLACCHFYAHVTLDMMRLIDYEEKSPITVSESK